VDVTKADLRDISITRTVDSVAAVLTYVVRTDENKVHHGGSIHNLPLSGAALQSLGNWAAQFLPEINAQEDLI
jgi:hypothetical protein